MAKTKYFSPDEEVQIQKLFVELDVNGDGKVDIADLTTALKRLQVPQIPGQAKEILDQADLDRNGHFNFKDFVQYLADHDKQLRLSFALVDHNRDGVIDAVELMECFKRLGVHIDKKEAALLIKRMDKDETLLVNYEEWRQFLLFTPASDIHNILHYWRHASLIDVGEDTMVPDDFTDRELRSGMWWKHLVAGGAAGAVSRTCTAPLDRVKVFLQVYATRQNQYGIISGFRYMLQEGGWKSFWRGNGMNVMKIAPESAIKFMAYEQVKQLFRGNSERDITALERFASGSLAGAISQSVIYPMEVLKTRLALRKTRKFNGILFMARHMLKREGARSFYNGYLPNLLGIIPYAGIDLCVYERQSTTADPGVFVLLACGTVSCSCGQLASYPFALVRTRLQAHKKVHGQSMYKLFSTIVRSEGFFGLYRGIMPNFMKVIPAVSISYVVYEHVRKLLRVEMT